MHWRWQSGDNTVRATQRKAEVTARIQRGRNRDGVVGQQASRREMPLHAETAV